VDLNNRSCASVAAIDARLWTQARAYTLGLNLLVSAAFYPEVTSWLNTTNWYDERTGIVAAGTALGCAVARQTWERVTRQTNP